MPESKMEKVYSQEEVTTMARQRLESDAQLRETGSDLKVGESGEVILIAPGEKEEERLQRVHEMSQKSWDILRNPEIQKDLKALKEQATALQDDFRVVSQQYLDSKGFGGSLQVGDDLREFAKQLQQFLKISPGTVASEYDLGIHPRDLFTAGSKLGENINYSYPSHTVSAEEDLNSVVNFMVQDGTSPEQVVDVINTKIKARLYDAAQELGKIT